MSMLLIQKNVVTPESDVVPEDVVPEDVPLDDESGPSCSHGFEINFIMNLQMLNDMINLVEKCPECNHDNMSVWIDPHKKKGLAQVSNLECPCGWSKTIFSSKRIDETNNKSRFDVNLRTVIVFREIDKGLSAIERYCSHMNTPSPMTNFTYSVLLGILHHLYVTAAEESMNKAASAVRNNESITDIDASFDGTWQRRCLASLNGVVTCIERKHDKCVDIEIKTKECKSCKYWEKRKGTDEYETWKTTHECSINFDGSVDSMESDSTVEICKRSVPERKLRYKTFIGDGDSSYYPNVIKVNPYPGLKIEKGECTDHAQKRVGTNLPKLRKELSKERKEVIWTRKIERFGHKLYRDENRSGSA